MESGQILMTHNISSTVATTAERNHQSQASKRVRSGMAATQYVAIVSNIIPTLSFFLPFYPRPMIPIISIRTILWHFFAFICYFRSQFLFFLFLRVRFVVIRRGQNWARLNCSTRKHPGQLKQPTSDATYGSQKEKLENWIKCVQQFLGAFFDVMPIELIAILTISCPWFLGANFGSLLCLNWKIYFKYFVGFRLSSLWMQFLCNKRPILGDNGTNISAFSFYSNIFLCCCSSNNELHSSERELLNDKKRSKESFTKFPFCQKAWKGSQNGNF